jgi:hypothetical protein
VVWELGLQCVDGKWHSVKYDTLGVGAASFVDLDDTSHLKMVTCDIDHTKIQLKFSNDAYAAEWLVRFHDWNDHYLIGGLKWDCPMVEQDDKGRSGLIIRRVIGAAISLSGRWIYACPRVRCRLSVVPLLRTVHSFMFT